MGKFGAAVSGGRHHTVWNTREHTIRALKKACRGKPNCNPWAIANKGVTKMGRKEMARKGALKRKLKRKAKGK